MLKSVKRTAHYSAVFFILGLIPVTVISPSEAGISGLNGARDAGAVFHVNFLGMCDFIDLLFTRAKIVIMMIKLP